MFHLLMKTTEGKGVLLLCNSKSTLMAKEHILQISREFHLKMSTYPQGQPNFTGYTTNKTNKTSTLLIWCGYFPMWHTDAPHCRSSELDSVSGQPFHYSSSKHGTSILQTI